MDIQALDLSLSYKQKLMCYHRLAFLPQVTVGLVGCVHGCAEGITKDLE